MTQPIDPHRLPPPRSAGRRGLAVRLGPAAVRALVFAALCAGCDPSRSDVDFHPPPDACGPHHCTNFYERVPGEPPDLVKGATFEVHDFGVQCRIDVSWTVPTPPARRFQAMVVARAGSLVPLREGLVQLSYFQRLRLGHSPSKPFAVVVLDPDPASWPSVAPDHVFIPLSGDATLDGITFVSARVDPPPSDGASASPSVTVALRSPIADRDAGAYFGLREGDHFRWDDADARVVRIVNVIHSDDSAGWIEVSLSGQTTPR